VQDDGTLLCQKSKKSCEFAMSWIVVNALQESKLDCAMQNVWFGHQKTLAFQVWLKSKVNFPPYCL